MFSYEDIKGRPELLLAMTSLTQAEFEELLAHFHKEWDEYVKQNYTERPDRKRQCCGGMKESTLVAIEDKLLFILFYFKTYPLQEVLAYSFEMTQSTANDWIHILSGVLQKALASAGYTPERDPDKLDDNLNEGTANELAIDGTERRIQRPKDNEEQKKHYSGKKKAHTVKNILIGSVNNQKINYLGQTHEGKKHDKKIVDEENPFIPEGTTLYKDTGFQGYEPEGVFTVQPVKKPRGKELTEEQQDGNRLISKVRVIIEHVISGVKRCRIVKDVFRNTKAQYDDLVMEIACALHNFRAHCRPSYLR